MRNFQTEKYHDHIPGNEKEDDVDQTKTKKENRQLKEQKPVLKQRQRQSTVSETDMGKRPDHLLHMDHRKKYTFPY